MSDIYYLFEISFSRMLVDQAQVVQMLDNTTHQIFHYPVDKYWGKELRYLVDRLLSGE